jgi:hypothetical protein
MRHLSFFTTLGLSLSIAVSSAATYYVDQTAGNDSNNGTSPSTAWKNAPGMSAYSGSRTLAAGDVVYFDRADVWSVTGTQGIFLTGGVTYIGDSFGSGTGRATIRAAANLEAGVVRFRDHATVPTVFQGFDVDGARRITSGIDINHRYYSLMNGAVKRVDNVVVHDTFSRQASGQYKYGIVISNFGGTAGYTENVEILNSVVRDVSRDAICLYPGDTNKDNRIRNITVRNNQVYNTGTDPDYCCGAGVLVKGYVMDAFIEYNYLHSTKGAGVFVNGNETNHFGVGPTNIHIRYNIVTTTNSNGAIRVYDGPSGADPKDLKIYGNIVYNSTVAGGLVLGSDLGNTNRLLVYNNTFYNAPVSISNSAATFPVFEFRNNIVYYPGGNPINNTSRFTVFSNNLTANPQFKNTSSLPAGFTGVYGANMAPASDGLSVLASSPALDAGAALAAAYAGSINGVTRPAGGAWDIGAYEAGSVVSTLLPPTNISVVTQ